MDFNEAETLRMVVSSSVHLIDPIKLTQQLLFLKFIDQQFFDTLQYLHQKGYRDKPLCRVLATTLPRKCPMVTFIRALQRSGQETILKIVVDALVDTISFSSVSVINRQTFGNRKGSQQLFKVLTKTFDDALFHDTKTSLRRLSDRYRAELFHEGDKMKRVSIAEKCLSVWGCEVDFRIMCSQPNLENDALLDHVWEFSKDLRNPKLLDVMVYGRLANIYAMARKFDISRIMVRMARVSAAMVSPCVEVAFMYYMIVYALLWQFAECPEEDLRRDLLETARIGMQYLAAEDEDSANQFMRMFLLRMVFCLLGLGNRGKIVRGCTISDSNVQEAKRLLKEVDSRKEGIERRREMLDCVARARLSEIEKESEAAQEYMKKAEEYAMDVGFSERETIERYRKELEMD